MSKPTDYPVAPSLTETTELYTQRREASEVPANLRFSLRQLYNYFRLAFGFSDTVKVNRSVASAEWDIVHGLGRNPVVEVYEEVAVVGTGNATQVRRVLAEVEQVDLNRVIVRFNAPVKGFALLNP